MVSVHNMSRLKLEPFFAEIAHEKTKPSMMK